MIESTCGRSICTGWKRQLRWSYTAYIGSHNDSKKSYVIYQYTCSCAETYVGKTTQRLSERIKQHIPPNIATRKSNQADSAILAHIRNKPACVPTNAQERFRILARARSSYHLDILEAMYIRSLEPSLCAQKEFVKSLTLFT